MPLKCSDPDKIVSRFAKTWHGWCVRPKVRPTLSSKRVTFSQNRVTIGHPSKHAHCIPKSWHAIQNVLRFGTFSSSHFWGTLQQTLCDRGWIWLIIVRINCQSSKQIMITVRTCRWMISLTILPIVAQFWKKSLSSEVTLMNNEKIDHEASFTPYVSKQVQPRFLIIIFFLVTIQGDFPTHVSSLGLHVSIRGIWVGLIYFSVLSKSL